MAAHGDRGIIDGVARSADAVLQWKGLMVRGVNSWLLASLLMAAGCSESSTQHLNAEQQTQLNDIAAGTTEGAGNDAAQNGQQGDLGDMYRAGASAPPRRYR